MQFAPFELLVFRLVFGEETHSRLYECSLAGMGHVGFRTHLHPRGRPPEGIIPWEKDNIYPVASCEGSSIGK